MTLCVRKASQMACCCGVTAWPLRGSETGLGAGAGGSNDEAAEEAGEEEEIGGEADEIRAFVDIW